MKMCKLAANCSDIIDWEKITKNLPEIGDQSYIKDDWKDKKDFNVIHRLWKDADINISAVLVSNYYPGEHFPHSVTEKISELLKLTHVSSWISKITPGSCVPYHWDFDPIDPSSIPRRMRRFSCKISKHEFGHVFIVEDQCFYNVNLGDLYEFPYPQAWHAGSNIGIVPKYMYHYIGY